MGPKIRSSIIAIAAKNEFVRPSISIKDEEQEWNDTRRQSFDKIDLDEAAKLIKSRGHRGHFSSLIVAAKIKRTKKEEAEMPF